MYIVINEEWGNDRLSFLITLIPLFTFFIFSLIYVKKFNFVPRPRCFCPFFFTIRKLLKKIVPQVVIFFYEKRPFLVLAVRYLHQTTSSIDKPIGLFLKSLHSEIVMLF